MEGLLAIFAVSALSVFLYLFACLYVRSELNSLRKEMVAMNRRLKAELGVQTQSLDILRRKIKRLSNTDRKGAS